MAELNLDFTLVGKTYDLTNEESITLTNETITSNEDWTKNIFSDLKKNIKKHYARKQKRKCAYCRSIINVDGYTDPIEHIVPKKHKPKWMFVQHNLVVSCAGCNSAKATDNTLINDLSNYGDESNDSPNIGSEYKIFNPHFDKWSDHFEFEDDFFLKPIPNTKGENTWELCNLWRYQIIIDHRDQLSERNEKSFKTLTRRVNSVKDSRRREALKAALEYVKDMIDNA